MTHDAATAEVRQATDDFEDLVHGLMCAGDPRVRRLGPAGTAPDLMAARLRAAETSSWTMHVEMSVRFLMRARSVTTARTDVPDVRTLAPRAVVDHAPLYAQVHPELRVAPVPLPLLLTDARHVLLTGPPGTDDADTVWESSDPRVVGDATDLFLLLFRGSRHWSEVSDRPRLGPRTVAVALRLCEGAGDQEIAAELGTSQRTVSAEVHTLVEWTGARSRTQAVAILAGLG